MSAAQAPITRMPASVSVGITGALRPLDALRSATYRVFGRGLGRLLSEPERRAFWLACALLTFALAGTVVWPLGLLALGPILWGIPHVVGDVRYLLLQPGYHRRRLRLVLVSIALFGSVVGGGIIAGSVAIMIAIAMSEASWSRRFALLVPGAVLLLWFIDVRGSAELVFAHLHNVVAVVWLLSLFRSAWRRAVVGLGFALGVAFLWTFPLSWVAMPHGISDMGLGYYLSTLAWGQPHDFGVRLMLVFAFAQAFHYAVWVRLVPELRRERRAPRGFRSSYVALERDFGSWLVLGTCGAMILLLLGAVWALKESREVYLRFALFHGYFELAFLAVAWLEAPRRASAMNMSSLRSSARKAANAPQQRIS